MVDDVSELRVTTQNLTILVANLTKGLEEHESTLRHIDDNVNEIKLGIANAELKYYKEVQQLVNESVKPAYDLIRKQQKEFNDFKLHAEQEHQKIQIDTTTDILKRIKTWAVIAAFILSGTGILIGVLYNDIISQLHTH